MRIALDTNVLVRLLVEDDPAQSALARRLIEQADSGTLEFWVPLTVLLETEWVLRSRFKLDKPAIQQTFAALLESSDVRVDQADVLEEALHWWRSHATDFADCLHAAHASRSGCQHFATFDLKAQALPRGTAVAALISSQS